MDRSINGVNVAVVGGAGFLGSHLVNHLLDDRNCRVLVIDNLISGRREFVHQRAVFEHADITVSESYLYRLFVEHRIDYVFNYAASPYIPVSFERPGHVFNTNAVGALNVINAADAAKVLGILQVSSAEIYGQHYAGGPEERPDVAEWSHIKEDAPVFPHSSYGAAKAAIDFMVQVRWREARTPCIALRQFNCVGERETHPYVIPEIISQLEVQSRQPYGTSSVLLGNNSQRDFIYAGDAVRYAVELLEKGQFGEVYNLGSESSIFIYELAKEISRLMQFVSITIKEDASRVRPWEIWYLCSDNSKIHSVVNYRPQVTFTEAIKRTIQDYYNNGWCWEK